MSLGSKPIPTAAYARTRESSVTPGTVSVVKRQGVDVDPCRFRSEVAITARYRAVGSLESPGIPFSRRRM
jgi:hypothetical protein